MKMSRKTIISGVLLGGLAAPGAALAELYISPVVEDTVRYDSRDETRAEGKSSVHGVFVMDKAPERAREGEAAEAGADESEVSEKASSDAPYGRNVPLFVALENLVPGHWNVHVDEAVENESVSWEGGESWSQTLAAIDEQNEGVSIIVNREEDAVGAAADEALADHYAHETPQIWEVKPGESMVENLQRWAERAGWHVDNSDFQYDYPIQRGARFTGTFLDAVSEFLTPFKTATQPVKARAHRGNQVLRLVKGGYRSEDN